MRAGAFFKAITRATHRGALVTTAAALALIAFPGSAAVADSGTDTQPCQTMQRSVWSTRVEVPATAGPSGLPGATGVVDTGVCVERAVRITATGTIAISAGDSFGPEGDTTRTAGPAFALPGVPPWSLIGRVGAGPWQYIGTGPTTLKGRGELYLAVNDDSYADNSGAITATLRQCLGHFHFGCRPLDGQPAYDILPALEVPNPGGFAELIAMPPGER